MIGTREVAPVALEIPLVGPFTPLVMDLGSVLVRFFPVPLDEPDPVRFEDGSVGAVLGVDM